MRAEPPPPRRQRTARPDGPATGPRRRCPYLEQIIKEPAGPFGWLVRYKADCHVDRRTHRFTGRRPVPPCISAPETCALYRRARADEDRSITRYSD